ncbi:hypothetical protein [Acrocarpospora corrugata]|uniref:hypothetical protein n=1 Tax=Acrocarpospora corrugata TaxID=35763 RepID=UPI001FEBDA71|nr:hypothetical protein [Acrocarpospora corrugata]
MVERVEDARERLRVCIDAGVPRGPGDLLARLLVEYGPRSLRDPHAAALESSLVERQVAIYQGVLVLGRAQRHFEFEESARVLAGNFVALEGGYRIDVLTGRRRRTDVVGVLWSYAQKSVGGLAA